MADLLQFATTILFFLIDLFTLFLIGGIFYVIGLAVVTMARNQQPRWDSIFYVVLILLAAIWLVQWYPKQVITSIRVALEESRPEAEQLRGELRRWMPGLPLPDTGGGAPTITAVDAAPTETPAPTIEPIATEAAIAPTATQAPTSTPLPSPTPMPTPCYINLASGLYPCPPTPQVNP